MLDNVVPSDYTVKRGFGLLPASIRDRESLGSFVFHGKAGMNAGPFSVQATSCAQCVGQASR